MWHLVSPGVREPAALLPTTDDSLFSTEHNGVLILLPKWGQERGRCYQAAVNLWSLLSGRVIWGWKVGGPPGVSNQHQAVYSSKLPPPIHSSWINNSIVGCTCPGTRSNSKRVWWDYCIMLSVALTHVSAFLRVGWGGTNLLLTSSYSHLFCRPLLDFTQILPCYSYFFCLPQISQLKEKESATEGVNYQGVPARA